MDRCRIGRVELEWDQTGAGEPVLLIHGSPATTFRPLMVEAALAPYWLIRYHRRNWAGSTSAEKTVTIDDHAADAAGLLTELDVGRAHVVGHSYGALVALQLAVEAGDLVASLALLEPNPSRTQREWRRHWLASSPDIRWRHPPSQPPRRLTNRPRCPLRADGPDPRI